MVPVRSSSRSERVVLPWSMCAMMQKLRVYSIPMKRGTMRACRCGVNRHHARQPQLTFVKLAAMPKLIISGTTHELVEELVTIGRAPENTIRLEDASVSSRHAELRATNQTY